VRHFRDTRQGKKALTDERDIYEIGANLGARRVRARILAIIPGDIVDAAVAQCRQTLAGKSDIPMADRVRKLVKAFRPMGVSPKHIEDRLGHSLDEMTADEHLDLQGAYKSIRDGMTKASEWFGNNANTEKVSAAEALKAAAKQAATEVDKEDLPPDPIADLREELETATDPAGVIAIQGRWVEASEESLKKEITDACTVRLKAIRAAEKSAK